MQSEPISADGFRSYIELFHSTYKETVEQYMPDDKSAAFRYPFLSGGTILYVSNTYGVGYEYVQGAPAGAILVKESEEPVDHLFTGAPEELRRLPSFASVISSSNTRLEGCLSTGRNPLTMEGEESSVFIRDCSFYAPNFHKRVDYAELFGNRSASLWSGEEAITRAKDEVLLALVLQQASPISIDYMERLKRNTVLVLGDYSPDGRARLEDIKRRVSAQGYQPLLVDEVPESRFFDLQQKALFLGTSCRFVVVDDSSASGHLVEFTFGQMAKWVLVVLRQIGSHGTFMTQGQSQFSTVILERDYSSETLPTVLTECVEWAESRISDLGTALDVAYPWRQAQ